MCVLVPTIDCLLIADAHDIGQAHAMGDPLDIAREQGPGSCSQHPQGPGPRTSAPWTLVPGPWIPWVAHGMGLAHVMRIDHQYVINDN